MLICPMYNISVNDTTNKRRVPALCYSLVELLTEYADAVVTQNTSTIATDNINLLVVNISDKGDQDFTYSPTLFDNKTEEVGLLSINMLPESQLYCYFSPHKLYFQRIL